MIQSLQKLILLIENTTSNEDIVLKLPFLRRAIEDIFLKIQDCKFAAEASSYFKILEKIHILIASLIFKRKINVSNDLWQFFKDFDRIDDQEEQLYFFEKIKNNQYSLPAK